jgi:amino acid adenylation domain-containing protein
MKGALSPNIDAIYPLTPTQKGILFSSLAAPSGSAIYFQQLTWTIRTELDPSLFRESWSQVVHRHDVLRTFFCWEGRSDQLQCVCTRVRVPWKDVDWRGQGSATAEQLKDYLAADRLQGFALNEAPLFRFHLIRLAADVFQFVFSFHHILLDGWSLPKLITEAQSIYRNLKYGSALNLERAPVYREFVAWHLRQNQKHAEEVWREILRGISTPTTLRVKDATAKGKGVHDDSVPQWLRLSEASTTGLRAVAKRHRCTLSTVVQAAWAILLRCYSGEADIVFGVTVAGRSVSLAAVDSMVGLFINTLPARIRLRASDCLGSILRKLTTQQIQREELSYTSLAEVQKYSEIPGGTALFDSIVVFENYPVDEGLKNARDPLAIHNFEFFEQTNYPLTILAIPGEELAIKISYDHARFYTEDMARLSRNLGTLLESIALNPDGRVCDIEVLPRADAAVLTKVNDTSVSLDVTKPLYRLIEAQTELTPNAVALITLPLSGPDGSVIRPGSQLTYSELNCRANQVARLLLRSGLGLDEPVGIHMERSEDLVVGLLGILKAGGAYAPLDPSYPLERLRLMIEDLRPRVVLTQAYLKSRLDGLGIEVIALDDPDCGLQEERMVNLQVPVTSENLAYVIYTSGSTGLPKGAMNTHGAVVNRLLWMQRLYELQPDDRILQKTPFGFDVSVWEFFWPLMTGAQLVVAAPGGHYDPSYLRQAIEQWSITTIHFVPSMLRYFLDALENKSGASCGSLRRVICSGEALSSELVNDFFNHLKTELHNLYGPTEAAIDVTAHCCRSESIDDIIPIGCPIANTQIHLLDQDMKQVPIGVAGELYIGGTNVGRGYWRNPDLTAEKFVPDPFSQRAGARLYRTGDLARHRADGAIVYLDRIDRQIKIRGLRIELGEIEAWVSRVPGVKECVVVIAGETPSDQRLVGYVTTKGDSLPGVSHLQHFLRRHLPDFMVPSTFVFLSNLPISPNGKLDRRALPAAAKSRAAIVEELVVPRSAAEEKIAEVWREILGVKEVGIHDSFFELGGNSLHLIPIQGRLERLFGKTVPLLMLFQYPTIRLLAEELTNQAENGSIPETFDETAALPDGPPSRSENSARLRRARLERRSLRTID